MRKSLILCSIPLLALAACHAKVDVNDADENSSDQNVHIAMNDGDGGGSNVSVDVPGFNAQVSLPNIDMSGHIDLDGIKLAPHSKVSGLDVNAHDGGDKADDDGTVVMKFTDTDPPASVIDHYAKSAVDAGYGAIARTDNALSAKKDDKSFTLAIAPDGAGSRGTITITGKDKD